MLLGFSLCPLKKNKRENAEFNHKFLYAPDNNAVIWRAESLFISMQSDVGNRAVPSPLIEVPFVGFHCTFTTATDATLYLCVCV